MDLAVAGANPVTLTIPALHLGRVLSISLSVLYFSHCYAGLDIGDVTSFPQKNNSPPDTSDSQEPIQSCSQAQLGSTPRSRSVRSFRNYIWGKLRRVSHQL